MDGGHPKSIFFLFYIFRNKKTKKKNHQNQLLTFFFFTPYLCLRLLPPLNDQHSYQHSLLTAICFFRAFNFFFYFSFSFEVSVLLLPSAASVNQLHLFFLLFLNSLPSRKVLRDKRGKTNKKTSKHINKQKHEHKPPKGSKPGYRVFLGFPKEITPLNSLHRMR